MQVHPTTQFIRENFGMYYTQDESYYLLDAKEGASVYLGLKTGINRDDMINDLREAQKSNIVLMRKVCEQTTCQETRSLSDSWWNGTLFWIGGFGAGNQFYTQFVHI